LKNGEEERKNRVRIEGDLRGDLWKKLSLTGRGKRQETYTRGKSREGENWGFPGTLRDTGISKIKSKVREK